MYENFDIIPNAISLSSLKINIAKRDFNKIKEQTKN